MISSLPAYGCMGTSMARKDMLQVQAETDEEEEEEEEAKE